MDKSDIMSYTGGDKPLPGTSNVAILMHSQQRGDPGQTINSPLNLKRTIVAAIYGINRLKIKGLSRHEAARGHINGEM